MHRGRTDAALAAVVGLPLGVGAWYGTVRWRSLRPYAWAIAAEVAAAVRQAKHSLSVTGPS